MTLDTPQLIKKIQQASSDGKDTPARREAFSELVRRYQDLAYGCALSMLGDPALAEDAAQNAFMTTYFTLHTINKPEVFAAWLRRIISRQCARMLKEQQHYKISIDEQSEIEDTSENPYETTAGSEEQQLVRHALTRLPADLRMTTVLYYLTGYSVGEIAACMELPQSTVKKRLHDARTRLRKLLEHVFESTLQRYKLSQSDTFVHKFVFFQTISGNDQGQILHYLDLQPGLLDSRGTWHWTPLIRVAETGKTDLVELFITRGARLSARETLKNGTALHWAARNGHSDVVACLLQQGASANDDQDCHRQGPLGWAVLQGHLEVGTAELLIDHGARPDIFVAVTLDRKKDVEQWLYEQPAAVDSRLSIYDEDERQQPLHLAIRHNRHELSTLLMDHHADLHGLTDAGLSPLCLAHLVKNTPAREALEQAHATPDLSALLVMGDWHKAQQILNGDRSVLEDQGPYGPLIHALARAGYTDAVRVLLEAGVSPNRPWSRQYDQTPLYTAALQNQLDTVRLLIDYGADVDVQDALWGATPLHYAATQGNMDMARLFVEAGAYINPIENAHLNTPLSWAHYKGHSDLVDYLAKHGGTTYSDELYVMP
jgi:RNA polymerase sigma factor (sigma-70 family)